MNRPELTIKSILLGIILSVVLCSANAYLGLFAGMTVSASIPAAVISMAIFRAFKNSNIFENNIRTKLRNPTRAKTQINSSKWFTILQHSNN